MKEKRLFPKEVLDFIQKHQNGDPYTLALKKSPFVEFPMKIIVQQIQGRKIAKRKFPFLLKSEQYRYPVKESLEQASSEVAAKYKSTLINGNSFVDLTGGMGIDSYLLGRNFQTTTYIEPNRELYEITNENFRELGFSECESFNMTCESFLSTNNKKYDWAYLDPSRRIGGERKTSIHNYEPNLVDLESKLLRIADNVLVKLSPMQDISECIDVIKSVHKIWVISIQNEVKELLLQLKDNIHSSPTIKVIDINNENVVEFSHLFIERNCSVNTSKPLRYLYQPAAAMVKAELQNRYALVNRLSKLHPNTHLYTSDQLIQNFMGRIFEIKHDIRLNKKEIKVALPKMQANVITKNFPLTPQEINLKLKLKDGGEDYLIAFTDLNDKKRVAICNRVT